ncbi:MAG TPA: heparinase II/III family protein, partial [Gemmatimonadales bacterium]
MQRLVYEAAVRTGWEASRRPATTWASEAARLNQWIPQADLTLNAWLPTVLPRASLPLGIPDANSTKLIADFARAIVSSECVTLPQQGGRVESFSEIFADHNASPHWTRVHEFADRRKDIRTEWEAARLGWAWALGRAAALTKDSSLADATWRLAQRWIDANPPMRGPHWHSGQEAALRLVALGWAAVATAGRTSTPGQPRTLALFAAVAAERVAARIEYAESQYNNHSLTEALGLLWGAALVPRHPDAQRWRRIATRVLRRELGRQVFTDGSFVQESIVYERLALEACLTVLWLDRSAGGALLDAQTRAVVTHKAGAMRDYLARMTDPTTNLFSRLGANDGTWLLMPVEDDFWDARPTRAVAESVLGPSPDTAPPTPTGLTWSHAADGAFTVLKGGRPGRRPTEADALHVEHRVNGVEVLRDAGSFRYIGPAGLDAWFRSAQAHNTVVVNGQEPLTKL